jgi:hypothetical protein
MFVNMLARRHEDAMEAALKIPNSLEDRRNVVILREDWIAQNLFFMDRKDEARESAAAALFRLKGMRAVNGEDYRIDLAEARVRALQGAAPDEVRSLVSKSIESAPADAVAGFQSRYKYAQIYAIAGMPSEAIEMLESVLVPPSDTSVHKVELDPAFDGLRGDPDFMAMMDKHR